MQTPDSSKPLRLSALGGFSKIGGSSALVQLDGVSILLDCGINSGITQNPVPPALRRAKPDLVLLSHAHIDHVGALPLVSRNCPGVPIYATTPTKKLAEIMLRDCMKLSSMRGPPIYSDVEIETTVKSIIGVEFDKPIKFRNISIVFRKAGHILGAASIVVDGTHRIVYSGDFSSQGTHITPGPSFPDPPEKCDLLFSEVTYGGRKVEAREAEEERMLSEIRKILDGGGRILIPSFALGRAQEVIVLLVAAIRRGSIPGVPIYLDGMVKEITDAYASLSDWLGDPKASELLTDWSVIKPVASEMERIDLLFGNEPCVIIASSGMLSGGWSVVYAKDTCSRKGSGIFFVGYLDEESPGHKLRAMSAGRIQLIDDEVVVKCKVDSFALSAHANHEGILEFARKYRPKFYVPVHGDPGSRWKVSKEVTELTKAVPILPFEEETYAVNTENGKLELILSESDKLANRFLRAKDYTMADSDEISLSLWDFLQENQIDAYDNIEQTVWSIFKLSGNFVTVDPWTTVKDRSRFFKACEKMISDHYPTHADHFIRRFHNTVPNFLANLILYGGNRSWLEHVAPVKVSSLEETEALLVQAWNELEVSPKLSDVYHRCRIRAEWPSDTEVEQKFASIFEITEPILSLLRPLPEWVKCLIVDSTLMGAVDGQVIFALVIAKNGHGDVEHDLESFLAKLADSQLFKLAGWQLDRTKVVPSVFVIEGGANGEKTVTRENFDEWLSEAIEPFKRDIPAGTFVALSELPQVLAEYGFDVKSNPNFIEVMHRQSGKRILVGVDPSGSRFGHYRSIRGCVVDYEKFKLVARHLSKLWKHKQDVKRGDAELGTDVIVSSGWHSYNPESSRRDSLEDAMEIYEYSHIVHILRMLDNYWGQSATHRKYATVARQDREWLEQTYGYARTAEVEGFNHDVREFCGLSFARTQYDRYLVITLT